MRYQHFKGEPNVRRSTPGPRVTALVSLAATLIFAVSRFAGATTINANSASQSDVAAAIASAADGDTVTIPGGTASWPRTLRVRKGITIQGAGVGVTIIKDGVQKGRLIDWTLAAGYPSRLTGIEFQDGGRVGTALAPGGILHVDGSNTNGSTFRWDNSKWNNLNGSPVFDTVIGVIDHNQFVFRGSTTVYIYDTRWNGADYGDGSWSAPTGYGSSQFLFIEDNSFTQIQQQGFAVTDAYGGARFVVRHNTIFNGVIANHGTESTGRVRGGRAIEIYNNTWTGTNLNNILGGARSGGVLFHDNHVSGFQGNLAHYSLDCFRFHYPFSPWGGADGTSVWDVNDPTMYFTGTAASDSSGTTVRVSGVNWTVNQWVNHTIRRTSNECNSNSLTFAEIVGNTANTITYTDNGGYAIPSLAFCAGDALEIRKVDHALDQPGRAGGSLITRDQPVRPRNWNDQVTEPCYSWNNGQVNFLAGPGVRAGVHYFNDTAMPGYTPYTYPHPLTKGLPLPEQMTRNATGISQRQPVRKRQPWGGKKLDGKKAKKAKASPTDEMPDGPESLGH